MLRTPLFSPQCETQSEAPSPRSRIERYGKGNLDSGKVGEEGGIINLEECSEGEGERNGS